MPKLIVNPDTAAAWEIHLKPGANLLGRNLANDFPVEHESVADMHCQVSVTDAGCTIKDLGSSTGTYVDDQAVSEAFLQNGQLLRIGEVLTRFEASVGPAASVEGLPPNEFREAQLCKYHPKARARYVCPQCHLLFCDLCVNRRSQHGRVGKFCRSCAIECDPVQPDASPDAPPSSGATLIRSAFTYPFAGDGLILLVAGTAFLVLAQWLSQAAPLIGMLLLFAASAYVIAYLQKILLASATGEDRMPDWPDFTGFGDLISPILQLLGTLAFSFCPAILVQVFAPSDSPWLPWTYWPLLALGCLYFPMAFIAVTLADSLSALKPTVIIPSILKILLPYLLAVGILAAVFGASWLSDEALSGLTSIPILPGLFAQFLGLYLAVVEMRILGVLYRSHQDELGWFRK